LLQQIITYRFIVRLEEIWSVGAWWWLVNQLPVSRNYVCSFVINAFIYIQLFLRSRGNRQKAIKLSLFVSRFECESFQCRGNRNGEMCCMQTDSLIVFQSEEMSLYMINSPQCIKLSHKTNFPISNFRSGTHESCHLLRHSTVYSVCANRRFGESYHLRYHAQSLRVFLYWTWIRFPRFVFRTSRLVWV
jgi:hypothetical protein